MRLPQDFRQVFRQGAYARKEYLGVHYYRQESAEDHGLVGFVVPKKALPLAVSRNRVKRQLRHIVLKAISCGDVLSSDKFVIRIHPGARYATSDELASRFFCAFHSAQARFDSKEITKAKRSS